MMIRTALLTAVLATLTACNSIPYRIDIDQGNVVDQKALSLLRVGMNKKQVQKLLGTPMVQDVFHTNRWDYIHGYKQGDTQATKQSKLTLHFTNSLLARIDKDKFQVIEAAPLSYTEIPQ